MTFVTRMTHGSLRKAATGPIRPATASDFGPRATVEDARRALATFASCHPDVPDDRNSVVSTRRIVDPLLDLWYVVAGADPTAAEPVETMLTTLVARRYATGRQLHEMSSRVGELLDAEADRLVLPL